MRLVVLLMSFFATAVPTTSIAQEWTREQQEVVDSLKECWDTWVRGVRENNPDVWFDQCTEKGYSYWSLSGTPLGEEHVRRSWDSIVAANQEWLGLRPVVVKVYDDFAVVQFWGYWQEAEGLGVSQKRRTEVFHRVDGQWRLVAGHATAVEP